MKWLIRVLRVIFFIIAILIIHSAFNNLAPYPFNTIHVTLLLLIYIIILKKSGTTVWMAFIIGFIFDTMSATPFGIFTISYTITTLILFWLFRDILTQQSFWAVATLTAIGLIIFRILYTLILMMIQKVLLADLMIWYGWELITTVIAGILLYFVFKLHRRISRA